MADFIIRGLREHHGDPDGSHPEIEAPILTDVTDGHWNYKTPSAIGPNELPVTWPTRVQAEADFRAAHWASRAAEVVRLDVNRRGQEILGWQTVCACAERVCGCPGRVRIRGGAIGVEEGPISDDTCGLGTTLTIDVAAAPTACELVVTSIFTRGCTFTNPAGMTTAHNIYNATEDDEMRVAYELSDGAQTQWVWTVDNTGDTASAATWVISGNKTSCIVEATNALGRTTGAGCLQPGSVTPTSANSFLVASAAIRVAGASAAACTTIDSCYTKHDVFSNHSSNNAQLVGGHKVLTSASAHNPTINWASTFTVMGIHVAFGGVACGCPPAATPFHFQLLGIG